MLFDHAFIGMKSPVLSQCFHNKRSPDESSSRQKGRRVTANLCQPVFPAAVSVAEPGAVSEDALAFQTSAVMIIS